jgi:hypothetical protein
MKNKLYELKQENVHYYKLTLNSQILGNSILKMFDNSYYNKDDKTVHFTCEKIQTFSEYLKESKYILSEQICIQIIDNLYKQFSYIIQDKYCLYGIDIEDILLVDNVFIFVSSRYILPLQNSKLHSNILIMKLFEPLLHIPYFSSPELIKMTSIPATIPIQTFYYSLASLVVYCLTNKYLFEGNDVKTVEEINVILGSVKFCKLYWFLERCLHPNPEERKCFLI